MKKILIITNIITLILLISYLFMLGKYIPLEIALQKISQKEYADDYKCLDFSNDLIKELELNGIQSSVILGESPETIKDNTIHAWVGIWIEPQTGEFTKTFTQIKN